MSYARTRKDQLQDIKTSIDKDLLQKRFTEDLSANLTLVFFVSPLIRRDDYGGVQVCDCPQKGPPETRLQKFGKLVRLVLKSAVAAGLVYWTSAEGVWGDGKATEDLYYRMMATVTPPMSDMPDVDNIKLPHVANFKYCVYDAYNRAVVGLMGILVGVPMTIQDKVFSFLFPCDPLEELESRSRQLRKDAQENKP